MLVYLSLVYFPLGHKDRLIVNTDENLVIKNKCCFQYGLTLLCSVEFALILKKIYIMLCKTEYF